MTRLHTAALALVTTIAALSAASLIAAPAAQAAGWGFGKLVSETRPVSGFTAIAQDGDIDLLVRQGAVESVAVQAEEQLLGSIETVVEPGPAGATLHVRYKRRGSIGLHRSVKVTVDVVRLTSLASAGSGDLTVEALTTPALKLLLSGAGDAHFGKLAVDDFDVRISGSADIAASGSAKAVRLVITGSGDADMTGLVADDVSVRIAGSGDANVTANKSLDAAVAGSGDIRWSGAATAVKQRVTGSGSVQRR